MYILATKFHTKAVWPFIIMFGQIDEEFPGSAPFTTSMEFGPHLFGECVANGGRYVTNSAAPYVTSFLTHNVMRIRKTWTRAKKKLDGPDGLWMKLTLQMEASKL